MLEGAYHQLARDALKENDGRRAELAYVEGLEQIPASAILRLHLGQLYQEWEIYQDAIRLLEEAKQLDSALAQRADALLGRIDDILSSREAVVIPIPEGAPSISAKVLLDGRMEETFVIDTGATYTAISETLARRLGYAFERGERINVTTAAGRMQVRRIRLVSVSLQGYAVHNLPVIVLPDSKGRSLNLLGLNFLNYFKYSVDSTRGKFRLERP
jgi:clan AA aspartic protease (TIGR02281 family)